MASILVAKSLRYDFGHKLVERDLPIMIDAVGSTLDNLDP